MNLHDYLRSSARAHGPAVAVEELSGAKITYQALSELATRSRAALTEMGVRPGDRVALCLPKSIDAVAAIFGILEAGAAYVPLDPSAPARRNALILRDCAVKVLIVERELARALQAELAAQGPSLEYLVLERVGGGGGLVEALRPFQGLPQPGTPVRLAPSNLAYLLYTSGSTGMPKGVMLSHENGVSFVEWCLRTFPTERGDRFSSHAAFNFDLSIHDIFVTLARGAVLVLLPEALAKDTLQLASIVAEQRITVWYSVPYALALMAEFGKLSTRDYSPLRVVLFAGEAFPVPRLRSLCAQWPRPRYYNLYGPTETNVCTHYEVPLPLASGHDEPLPIGRLCDHLRGLLIDDRGAEAADGTEAELCVSGSNVLLGYWNLPEHTQRAFLPRPGRFYRTGDTVVRSRDGTLRFLGRRDRMVKKRGFRVELGEVESCLYAHPRIKEAAVVASSDDGAGLRIVANLCLREGERMSIIELRRYCVERLPAYMIPDAFRFCSKLPRTGTDKVDYQRLATSG